MKEISIEHLAYHLKQANDRDLPKPIFFLGAGASFSGKIPLANDIAAIIIKTYHDNPDILMLPDADKTYSKLMGCLSPIQRNELLSNFIEEAKINVTHIYLAQLIKKNLVDFVLTANFDNLMLRALALFDIFPPVYDLTSISDFTTTTIKDKSIVYLHGQHNGTWLLNTDEEMTKVKTIVPRIFDTIKNKRPWIFLGYSGSDQIFEHIKNLGRFDNGLYWVGHDDYLPSQQVQDFLNKPNTNTHFIKGYDADAFMLKLNHELGLEQPDILDKPFSSLKTMLSNIVDIDDEDHFRGAKVRLEIARKNVDYTIQAFEDMKNIRPDKVEKDIDKLKKDIIDLIISEKYDDAIIRKIDFRAQKYSNQGINELLAELFFYVGNKYSQILEKGNVNDREGLLNITITNYDKSIKYMPYSSQSHYNCGVSLSALAALKIGTEAEALYEQAIEKYKKAIELNPHKDEAFNNLGVILVDLAKFKSGEDVEELYHQGFEKYRQTIELNPSKKNVLNNWGIGLSDLAALKTGTEAETLHEQAIEKFKKAIEINPEKNKTIYSLGFSLLKLADILTGEKADKLYKEAFEQFQKALDANVDSFDVLIEWATGLSKQATTKTGTEAESLYEQAIEKYKKASEIDPNNKIVFYNWGLTLGKITAFKTPAEAEILYKEVIEKYGKASEIDATDIDMLNNWGSTLIDLAALKAPAEAEILYKEAIEKFKQGHRIDPNRYELIENWGNSLLVLGTLKTGTEAETLYEQAIEKFKKAIKINPNRESLLENWSCILLVLAEDKTEAEAKELYEQACKMLEKAYELGGKCYNLACSYAKLNNTKDALKHLETSLGNGEVTVRKVLEDEDWERYREDGDFKRIMKKHAN